MRAKVAVTLGFVLLAAIVWIAASRKKPAPTVSEPAIISSLVTASASASAAPLLEAGPTYAGGFCAAMERTSHVGITMGSKLAGRVLEDVVPKPSCIDGDLGGWALRVDDAYAIPNEYNAGQVDIGFAVVLVHRDANGALATYALPHDTWHPDGGPPLEVAVSRIDYYGSRSLYKLESGDIDGDRDPEVFIGGGIHEEGPDPGYTLLLTFKEGAIRPYPTDLDVAGVEDVDSDGRLDILTSGRYAHVMASSQLGSDYPAIGGVFAAHALEDGGLSMTDTVAKSFLRKACPKKEPVTLGPEWVEPTEASQQILCARAWGASEADVKKQLSARCTAYDETPTDMAHCPTALLDAAKVPPEVTLP